MKRIKKPQIAIIDGDLALFPAASSPDKTRYFFVDSNGERVTPNFENAASASAWKDSIDFMGVDIEHGFKGDPSELRRESIVEEGDFETAQKNYKSIINRWLKQGGAKDFVIYLSKNSGAPNFRHDVAIRKPYKGNRDSEKPRFLEPLRRWALEQKKTKKAVGGFEVDDVVCHNAQKLGETGLLIQNEKDGQQVVGCWLLYPDLHDQPVFSDPKIVGYIEKNSKGKIVGLGWLFLLHQIIVGDQADYYDGVKGAGPAKALELLTPFNNKPISQLGSAIETVGELYRDVYGDEHELKDKNGKIVVVSWKDLMVETTRLAYMVKGRDDYPRIITDVIGRM